MLMAACLVLTLPLEVIFQARVYRRPKRLVRSMAPVVAVFYAWDAVAIARGHWFFNPQYVTGWRLPFGVPFDELVFFIVIPICALLAFEAVGNLLDQGPRALLLRRGAADA